ncbi:MAG: glycerate-2-kinase family protein, partial [Polyangiaceae bacterium]|nr:glycerate-2-kinase family protein [Polyangiaceae bacterium]
MQSPTQNSIETAWNAALNALNPATLVHDHVIQNAPSHFRSQNTRIIAVGKAAPKMAYGAVTALNALQPDSTYRNPNEHQHHTCRPDGAQSCSDQSECATDSPTQALVITTDDTQALTLPTPYRLMRASHPIPDGRSLLAAQAALTHAATSAVHPLIVLISGGASALLCSPSNLSLAQKRAITVQLIKSGATIHQCNTVRRHISQVKGGGLAQAHTGPLHCIILS